MVALLYLLNLQLRLEESVEERSQTLHLLRVVVTVDGLQLQPDEGFVGIVRTALVNTQFENKEMGIISTFDIALSVSRTQLNFSTGLLRRGAR